MVQIFVYINEDFAQNNNIPKINLIFFLKNDCQGIRLNKTLFLLYIHKEYKTMQK